MHSLNRKTIALAIGLSALAGCVDVIGFLHLGGFFVSFMSGNSTRLAAGLASSGLHVIAESGGIIALFVTGAILGTLTGGRASPGRHIVAVLSLVACLLAGAAACTDMGYARMAIILITLAMGAENAAFQRDGDTVVGVTYMTGTLVKIGQRIAYALKGGPRYAWLPYLLLWLGLVCGGVIGATLFHAVGLRSLWLAAIWAAALAFTAHRQKVSAHAQGYG